MLDWSILTTGGTALHLWDLLCLLLAPLKEAGTLADDEDEHDGLEVDGTELDGDGVDLPALTPEDDGYRSGCFVWCGAGAAGPAFVLIRSLTFESDRSTCACDGVGWLACALEYWHLCLDCDVAELVCGCSHLTALK